VAEVFFILTITVPFLGPAILKHLPEIALVLVLFFICFSWLKGREPARLITPVLVVLPVYLVLRGDYWISYLHSRLLCVTNVRVEIFNTVRLDERRQSESSYSKEFRWRTGQYYEIEGERYKFDVERHGLESKFMSQLYRVNFVGERLDEPFAAVYTFAPNRGWFDKVFGYANATGPWFCEGRALRKYGRGEYGEPDLVKLVLING